MGISGELGAGRRPEACPTGLRLPSVVLRCADCVCVWRNEIGGALFICEIKAGIESSPELSGVSPGNEWRQRERGKATGFTRELCTDADEHRSEEERDEHSARALCRWPDHALARCGELRRRRAAGRS